jgi:hypothetical protein
LVAEIGWLKKEKPEKMQLSEIEINEYRELGFEAGMRPVTKWGFFAMFAAAPRHFLFFFDFDFHGRQICSGGDFLLCLQPHHATFFFSLISTSMGDKSVPV